MKFMTNAKQMYMKLKFQNVFITKQASHAESHTDYSLVYLLSTQNFMIRSFWEIYYHSNFTKKNDVVSRHRLPWYPMRFDLASDHNV